MQGRKEYSDRIRKNLAILEIHRRMNSSLNLNDLAVEAENTICGLLNLMYGWNLVNANVTEHPNFAAVDLVDTAAGVAVQVTARSSKQKIAEMVKQFQEKELKLHFYRLIMVVLGTDSPTKEMKELECTRFCGATDIWNFNKLIRDTEGMDVDKLRRIAEYLDKELGMLNIGSGAAGERVESDRETQNRLMDVSSMSEVNVEEQPAFCSHVKRGQVGAIYFRNSLKDIPDNAENVSLSTKGRVMAWAVKTGELYNLFIAAEGKVYAPENSANLFRGMTNLTAIHFNDSFSTKNVENMRCMFNSCKKLKKLDLSFFETERVTDMTSMFCYCYSLSELDVSKFNTARVQTMHCTFYACQMLRELDVGSFDTSGVTTMYCMFNGCNKLSKLDVSGFHTARVTDMRYMFKSCKNLADLNISGWDLSSVKQYDEFMPEDMTVNGRPWEELFKKV